mmetsp:Transcript_21951/g.51884  ORF Transcript_21951/g.51884 Transcript_21951/m.51884 type:complete len:204 (+) Transcript_21951:155-766(+)
MPRLPRSHCPQLTGFSARRTLPAPRPAASRPARTACCRPGRGASGWSCAGARRRGLRLLGRPSGCPRASECAESAGQAPWQSPTRPPVRRDTHPCQADSGPRVLRLGASSRSPSRPQLPRGCTPGGGPSAPSERPPAPACPLRRSTSGSGPAFSARLPLRLALLLRLSLLLLHFFLLVLVLVLGGLRLATLGGLSRAQERPGR